MSLIAQAFRAACKELDYSPWPQGARYIRAGGRIGGTIHETTDTEGLEASGAEILFTDPATIGTLLDYVSRTLADTDEILVYLRPKRGQRPVVHIRGEGSTVLHHGDTIAEALVGILQAEAACRKAKKDKNNTKEESQ